MGLGFSPTRSYVKRGRVLLLGNGERCLWKRLERSNGKLNGGGYVRLRELSGRVTGKRQRDYGRIG